MTVSKTDEHVYRQLPGRRSADPLPGSSESSSVRLVELASGAGRTAHRHPHSEEIIYVESGNGFSWIEGEQTEVGPGDVIHVPQGAAHATLPQQGSIMRLICFFPHGDLGQNIEETEIEPTQQEEVN